MDMGLKGVGALVAASSEGLGKAIALGLAREGASVLICARRADLLQAAAEEIRRETGADVLAVPCDVADPAVPAALVEQAVTRFGRLDVLVNNAGGPPSGDFTKHDDAAWQRAFEANLMSAVRFLRAALPHLRASGRGRIINMTSTAVKQPIDGLLLSNAIRTGVIGLARTLAVELAPDGITINNIAPGKIDTARIQQLDRARAAALNISDEEARTLQMAQVPMGRYGTAEEVANLAVFLASSGAGYITGTTTQVDGGLVRGLL